jgi:uncharacterized cupredoxin-like copper-binding protein
MSMKPRIHVPRRRRACPPSLALVVAGALLLAACSGNSGPAQEVELKANEFSFAPASLTLKQGQRVRIRLQNSGIQLHDFATDLPATNITETGASAHMHDPNLPKLHVAAERGTAATITFTPTQGGTFPFFCTVPGHREAGMEGKLTVE